MDCYKKCPLKKRPIKIEQIIEQPEDLSLKTKYACNKKHFDLSSNSFYDRIKKNDLGFWYTNSPKKLRLESPTSVTSETSSHFMDCPYLSTNCETLPNIHLRGLTHQDLRNYNNSNTYWTQINFPAQFYHSRDYTYNLTPPSSPSSNSEPEDLSLRRQQVPSLFYAQSNFTTKASFRDAKTTVYRFQCDKCRKSYSTCTGLSKHQQLHCPAAECNKVKKEFSCKSCDKVYTSLGALKMHIRTHTLPCKCPHCGKAFSRPWLLQGHIRTHTGEKPFACNHCHRAFADRSNLRAHQQTHVEVKKYICEICKKSFSRMSLLTKHVSGPGGCSIQVHSFG